MGDRRCLIEPHGEIKQGRDEVPHGETYYMIQKRERSLEEISFMREYMKMLTIQEEENAVP